MIINVYGSHRFLRGKNIVNIFTFLKFHKQVQWIEFILTQYLTNYKNSFQIRQEN